MANRVANLLGNTKTRTLVLLVIGMLVVGVVIAVSQTGTKDDKGSTERVSKTTDVPNQVKSTPGEQVSRKYHELQEKANIKGAQEAAKKGTTFIPTLTGTAEGYNDADFDKQLSSSYDDLGGKCSKETVAKLKKEGLDTTKIIMQLKSYGCSAAAISALFSRDEIAAALLAAKDCGDSGNIKGCSADDAKKLKDLGYDARKIAATFKANNCNYGQIAAALKANGVSANEIAAALKANGASTNEIAAALKASGASTNEIAAALKANGASTNEIAAALKANGASTNEIAAALKASGASIDEIAAALKANGADASEIASALSKAGFSKVDILPALTKAGFGSLDIAKAISSLDLDKSDDAALLALKQNDSQRLTAQQEAQQLSAFSQQRQSKIQELVGAMEAQKKLAVDAWSQIPIQTMVVGDWANNEEKNGSGNNNSRGGSTKKSGGNAADEAAIILKAGSIFFAVLDTAVNSDEPGPVMATIVSGPLKGSKLLGSMKTQTDADKISLTFTAINMPNEAKSMGITAVAIDPDTARTALASDVDHHYLMRWGSLFASSFMQGYASAIANAGTTTVTSQGLTGTTTTSTSAALNPKQELFQGLSSFGSKWSEVVGKNFDRPNTITIDQGTGIGVLVTADLSYGTDPEFFNTKETKPTVNAAVPQAPAAGGALAPLVTAINNSQQANSGQVANTTTTTTGGTNK